MTFLANPCPCGWSLDEKMNEFDQIISKSCKFCKRNYVLKDWGWDQITPRLEIVDVTFCKHKRVIGESCPYCLDNIAK